jgi:hypothetical protein
MINSPIMPNMPSVVMLIAIGLIVVAPHKLEIIQLFFIFENDL